MGIKIIVDLAKSPRVILTRNEALDLLECIEESAWFTRDLGEAVRIIENFSEFYSYVRKKFEEYITLPKDSRDSILGRVIVHKLKLFKEDGREFVEIVFDRRFSIEHIEKCLKDIGYDEVEIERQHI